MAYIVDGNNVMGQTHGWHRDKPSARRRLVEQLAAFAFAKKARVTVVFDGEPDRLLPEASAHRGVKIFYAEKGSDADARIERIVESAPDPRGLTVVTSDRHLAFVVRSCGAKIIRSGEFRKQIEQSLASKPSPDDDEVGDVNSWLRYFGASPDDDEKGNDE
ncbi:MAG: NYN domain-containing protein [Blastocatellia bacterium]